MSRLLIIGLDGAAPELVERWMGEGRLPNLARLRDAGVFSPLRSTIPPATFPAWTSFMTGMGPGRHGVFDFTRKAPNQYAVEFLNATHRRAPTLWRLASDAGLRVGVMNVPATYPPERLNGFQIGGFDSPVVTRIDRRFVEPPELHDEIARRFGFYSIAPFQELRIGPGWHRKALPALLANLDHKARVALFLLKRERWDCFMALFGESDTVSHHFWMFHDPASPRYDPQGARELGDAIRRVYERLDGIVGQLIEAAGADANVFVVSDHGFGGAGDRVLHLNRWLAEREWLAFRSGGGALARWARRVGPRFVPQRAQEALFRVAGGRWARDIESCARFGAIDWQKTLAYSEELNYFPSIRLNLRGRDPQGVLKEDDVNSFVAELREAAARWTNPETGEPFINRVWRREELYAGPYVDEAPDLILELNLDRNSSYVCLASPPHGGPSTRKLTPDEFLGAKNRGMNGSHRPHGILFAAGPGIRRQSAPNLPRLQDLAPTALTILGLPGAEAMDGCVLAETLALAPPHKAS
ncbi:MAG: alkaline phosphatase family protein, partial [Candidatus Sumerlaeota bacterium]|nr:alkaline phosphatase family protein [Candidatus Sumerlaeota bacterium]